MAIRGVVSRNITSYRIQAGMSKKEFAKRAKMTPRYVTYLEKNDPAPNVTLDVLERVAKALGVTVAQLVSTRGETDGPPPPQKPIEQAMSLLAEALDTKGPLRSALDLLQQAVRR